MRITLKKYLAEFVYGATDGTVTTFAIIAGAVGASLSSQVILILGFANLLADGFSMATSNYLSTKSQKDLDQNSGLKENPKKPIKTAFATFLSFVLVGSIPILSFAFAPMSHLIDDNKFIISAILTSLAFIIIGAIKGTIVHKSPVKSGLESFFIGGLAACIAFTVGFLLKNIF